MDAEQSIDQMTRAPRVSILMLTFNRPQYIGRAIQSVLEQTFEDWELIVVQDGMHAGVQEIARAWAARDHRIHYFHRTQIGNIANAYNFGLDLTAADFIAILDDDDVWIEPAKLARQVAFFDQNPDYVGCGGGMIVCDHTGTETMRYLKPEHDGEIRRSALVANPIAHSTSMFRRLSPGLARYDDSLAGYQDWDLWLRLGMHGKLYNFRDMFTRYTLWQGGGSFQQQRANAASAVRIVWRHRKTYRGLLVAITLTLLQCGYAILPGAVRRSTFSRLSRLKKRLFSGRAAALPKNTPSREPSGGL